MAATTIRISFFIAEGRLAREAEKRVLTSRHCGYEQALHDLSSFEVGLDDFINVVTVYKGVPDRFRVNNRHRASGAAVETACFVDPNHARFRQTGGFDEVLAAVKAFLGSVLGAAVFTVLSLIETKEDVPLVIGGRRLRGDTRIGLLVAISFIHARHFSFLTHDHLFGSVHRQARRRATAIPAIATGHESV